MSTHFLHDIMHPKSIAFYGANNKSASMGSSQFMNVIIGEFKGRIYPIHLKLDSVMGFKAYKTISELPETPELVVIVIPPKNVIQVFKECGEKGVKNIILGSGGFREMAGEHENAFTEEILEIADKYGIRFIGPNCLGFYNNWIYPEDDLKILNTSIWSKIKRGNVSIASQSGTLSSHIFFDPEVIDFGLSKSISVGNEANIDIVDCLDYFKQDDKTDVIGLYIEEVKRGKEFLKLAKQISPTKPICAIYVGGSEVTNRAIKSHTGSMAGNAKIYDAAFKKAGIIKTELVEEFLDLLMVFSKGIIPKGKRLGIITNSGGPGAMIANQAEKLGLIVPEFSQSLQEKFKTLTTHTASHSNPLDLTFDRGVNNLYVTFPKVLMKSGEIDAIIIYGAFDVHAMGEYFLQNEIIKKHLDMGPKPPEINQMAQAFINPTIKASRKYSIPIFYVTANSSSGPWAKAMREWGANVFQLWDRPVRCMAKLCEYGQYQNQLS